MNDASEQALQFIIKQRLDKLKNNFVIETNWIFLSPVP